MSRSYTIATASTVPSSVALPDELSARYEALQSFPPAQRTWAGAASDATIQRWLIQRGLPEAMVSRVNSVGYAKRSTVKV